MKTFKTNNVIIRRFQMKDADQEGLNLLLYNNSNIVPEEIIDENRSLAKTKLIIKSAINEYYTDEPIWALENKESKKIIGYIRVCNYSIKNKMCNVTWAISSKHMDERFIQEALVKIFNFLFSKKNIELIECSYYEQRKSDSIILDGIGMTREATLRNRRVNEITNKKENFVIYSISKDEFYKFCSQKAIENKQLKFLKRKI